MKITVNLHPKCEYLMSDLGESLVDLLNFADTLPELEREKFITSPQEGYLVRRYTRNEGKGGAVCLKCGRSASDHGRAPTQEETDEFIAQLRERAKERILNGAMERMKEKYPDQATS